MSVGRLIMRRLTRSYHSNKPLCYPLEQVRFTPDADIRRATVRRWYVDSGTFVGKYDPLVELDSDDFRIIELTSEFEGVVQEIVATPGTVCRVGDLLYTIDTDLVDSFEGSNESSNKGSVSSDDVDVDATSAKKPRSASWLLTVVRFIISFSLFSVLWFLSVVFYVYWLSRNALKPVYGFLRDLEEREGEKVLVGYIPLSKVDQEKTGKKWRRVCVPNSAFRVNARPAVGDFCIKLAGISLETFYADLGLEKVYGLERLDIDAYRHRETGMTYVFAKQSSPAYPSFTSVREFFLDPATVVVATGGEKEEDDDFSPVQTIQIHGINVREEEKQLFIQNVVKKFNKN